MCAALFDHTLSHHEHLIGIYNIRKTVRDQNNGLFFCKFHNHFHNLILALHIDVRCRLVKNINITVVQNCPRQCDSLFLTAGKICRLLRDFHGKSALLHDCLIKFHLL